MPKRLVHTHTQVCAEELPQQHQAGTITRLHSLELPRAYLGLHCSPLSCDFKNEVLSGTVLKRLVADQQPLSHAGMRCCVLIDSNLHMLPRINSATVDTVCFAKV